MSANLQSVKQSKGFAIASLVLGIASIPTFGLLVVGAITGIILGAIALNRIKQNPQVYGGRNLAIAGIITSAVSLVLIAVWSLLAAIALPALQKGLKEGRQTAAINQLRTIHQQQAQFNEMKGRFGTLDELVNAGLLDRELLGSKPISGYRYTDSDVSENTYCVHADRISDNAAAMDFVLCEDGIIRYVESKTKGIVKRGEGIPLGTTPAAPTATP